MSSAGDCKIHICSVNMLADDYIKNHKVEAGYIVQWKEGQHGGRDVENGVNLFAEYKHFYNKDEEDLRKFEACWPAFTTKCFTRSYPKGYDDVDAHKQKYIDGVVDIESQKHRLERFFTHIPDVKTKLKIPNGDDDSVFILGMQEMNDSSSHTNNASVRNFASHSSNRRVKMENGTVKKSYNDYAVTHCSLAANFCSNYNEEKPSLLTTYTREVNGVDVLLGVFNIHGVGGQFSTYDDKTKYMQRQLTTAINNFEEKIAKQPAIFIALGDWNVQWCNDTGQSVFEKGKFQLTHFSPKHTMARANNEIPGSMYAHEYGNYGTLIDHIAWRTYSEGTGYVVNVTPVDPWVGTHEYYINAPIGFGLVTPKQPIEETITDHAPVGVTLAVSVSHLRKTQHGSVLELASESRL